MKLSKDEYEILDKVRELADAIETRPPLIRKSNLPTKRSVFRSLLMQACNAYEHGSKYFPTEGNARGFDRITEEK